MYRVIAIVGSALALAACSSTSSDWLSLDGLKPAPVVDTVRFESEPPGADVKTAAGQTCKTPCALALPTDAQQTVTFTLNGYLPETDQLEVINTPGSPPQLRPNPVLAELSPAPPPPKPAKKKPAHRRAAKPATKPRPAAAKPAAAVPAAAPAAAPAGQPAASPWPAPPPPQQR